MLAKHLKGKNYFSIMCKKDIICTYKRFCEWQNKKIRTHKMESGFMDDRDVSRIYIIPLYPAGR